MNRNELANMLRSEADATEGEYQPRPLPLTVGATDVGSSAARVGYLRMAMAAAAGGAAVLVLSAIVGWPPGSNREPITAANDPNRPCRIADFDVRSEPWPDAPAAGGVLIVFTARESVPCVLDQGLHVSAADANGRALIEVAVMNRDPVAVEAGTAWQAGIAWSTYCRAPGSGPGFPEDPPRPIILSVTLGVTVGSDADGVPITTGDALVAVDPHGDVLPQPCAVGDQALGAWLTPTGLVPHPGALQER